MDSRALILATIFVSLLSHFSSQIQATDLKALKKACDGNYNSACLQTLQADLKTKSFKDLKAVSQVAVDSTKKDSADIREFFSSKFKASPKKEFKECASYFDQAIKQLQIGGLEDGTASLDIHYAYDAVDSCETALANAKISDAEIKAKILGWRKVYSVASSAVNAAESGLEEV